MLQILPTPNYAGFELRGDSSDFRSLLSAIYYIDNEAFLTGFGYNDPMNAFFGLAYELRYALEGRRGFVCTDNDSKLWNFPDHTKLYPEVPEKNLYYAVRIPAISLLFYVLVSDELIALDIRARADAEDDTSELAEKEAATAILRLFCTAAWHALDAVIGMPERLKVQEQLAFARTNEFYLFRNYLVPYTDLLSDFYLSLPKMRRKRLLPVILGDLICYAKNDTYLLLEKNIRAWAKAHHSSAGAVKYSGCVDWNKIKW